MTTALLMIILAQSSFSLNHLLEWLGRFHVLVIHFPIAMFIGAAIAETWMIIRRAPTVSPTVRFCVFIAALGAVAAALLGWPHAILGGFDDSPSLTLKLHRWLGTTAAVMACLAFVFSEFDARRRSRTLAFRILLFSTTILIGVAAHFGGLLSHGDDYFKW